MADIKTRDIVKGTIKTIDKAAVASERMKQAYISTKERAENSTYAAENSADEYASDKFERGIDATVHEGTMTANPPFIMLKISGCNLNPLHPLNMSRGAEKDVLKKYLLICSLKFHSCPLMTEYE